MNSTVRVDNLNTGIGQEMSATIHKEGNFLINSMEQI